MGSFFDISRGKSVDPVEISMKIRAPSIIFYGEQHENNEVVKGELSILKEVYKLSVRKKLRLIIGMEHFNIQQQKILEEFLEDRITWKSLVDRYSEGPEGFDLEYYKPILFYAKKQKLRIIGLMPPRNEAKVVVRKGLTSDILDKYKLDENDIKSYPRDYFDRFSQLVPRDGPMAIFGVEQLVLAQSFKDEVMALSIARALNKGADLFYGIMGTGHCEHKGTVPSRIGKYVKNIVNRTIITTRKLSGEESPADIAKRLRKDGLIIASYVYIT
ncbi:MAG: ChaN family lipoprotein [Desulfurococcales archaeon]|nr:ChaN family lipoprotein [Desulfurococcales archaeon]